MFTSSSAGMIVVYAAVILILIGRQFLPQQVRAGKFWIAPVVMIGYGLYLFLQSPPSSALDLALIAGNVAIAAVLGFARGWTVRVWQNAQGIVMRQGTVLTVALWIVSFALKFGLDLALHVNITTASILLFAGVSFGSQALALALRVPGLIGGRDAMNGIGATRY
jgi:hypothetical protein